MKSKYLKFLIIITMVFSFLTLNMSNYNIVNAAENEAVPEVEIRVNGQRN